jgi:hypothetical protein
LFCFWFFSFPQEEKGSNNTDEHTTRSQTNETERNTPSLNLTQPSSLYEQRTTKKTEKKKEAEETHRNTHSNKKRKTEEKRKQESNTKRSETRNAMKRRTRKYWNT